MSYLSTPDRYFEFTRKSYNDKLKDLRTVELKGILARIGEYKQDQDLVDRILDRVLEETKIGKHDLKKLIDETYWKMSTAKLLRRQIHPETEKGNVEPTQQEKIRCVCGSSSNTGEMIRCQDQTCGVLQHKKCVVNIPEKLPRNFYCDLCRLSRADPFCLTLPKIPLPAVNLPRSAHQIIMSKTFFLTVGESEDILTRKEYEVQAWCMLLNDEVPFRVQWPKQANLSVNGREVQPTKKPDWKPFNANSRDDGVNVSQFTKAGVNNIGMTVRDSRMFCFGVRLVKRRTVKQVMDLIPGESQGEKLDDAVARVRRCVGGGGDGDDVEVVSHCVLVNLRCPMSGSRIKVAGRFKPCVHMGCFDLEVFLEMNMRSKKWQCPVCLKNYCLNDVIIDPYFNRVATRLRNLGQDVNEVEVKPDGCWRAKSPDNNGGLWHAPDGSYVLDLNMEDNGNGEPEELEAVSVNANGDEFGDAEVIALSDSEDDETDGAGQQDGLAKASLKRARERSDCPFSVPDKRLCSDQKAGTFFVQRSARLDIEMYQAD